MLLGANPPKTRSPMFIPEKRTTMRATVSGAVLLWLAGGVTFAADRVDYARGVKPILAARCYACHGALKQKNGLRLDTVALMKQGGDAGPAVVPGHSADSPLVAH